MTLAQRLRDCLAPPYSVSTILMLGLSALAVVLVALNGVVSYRRVTHDTMVGAEQAATSIASLLAAQNTEAYIMGDVSALRFNLGQVVRLPGVDAVAILGPSGRVLAEARKAGVTRGAALSPQPHAGHATQTRRADDHAIEVWARLDAGSQPQPGWVRVEYGLQERAGELQRLWRRSLYTLLGTVGLIMLVMPLLLRWALRPLQQLSQAASNLSSNIGSTIAGRSLILEANRLARALNKASHEVAEHVARTQAIVNTAAVAIISLDEQGDVISANAATTSIFGLEERQLVGLPLQQCIPGLSGEELRGLFGGPDETASRVYRIVRHDFYGVRLGGTPFPIEVTLGQAPLGGNLRYVCIVRDVTDERAAQETSELYERALASSHNGVFITNAAMTSHPIIFINDAFQKITGLAPHQVLGRGIDFLRMGNHDEAAFHELEQALAQERSVSVTLQHRLDKGREITTEVSLSPVRASDGRLTNFIGIVSDVTARVQAEAAIAERSAQLDAIFSLSPDGFVLFDEEGNLIFANPAFERMTGRVWKRPGLPPTLEEFEYSVAALCHHDHPMPPLKDAADAETPWQARLVFARPQHRVVQAQARRNVAGRSETILYFRDVTHEDEVDRMKSEFLASAAHELRTPMVSIFGFTELLLRRNFSEERRTDMLQTIHRQSGLLVKMINELLDLARIESRRGLDLQIGEHPLLELVSQSVKGLMRKEGERQVSVGLVPDVPVLIDPAKMQLALNNLLSNAFKYSPQGGTVTLSGELAQRDGREYAVLEVRDQGIGMKPEQLERAFERFYRADTTGNIPGTGLGLCLVKEVAELHAGRVELESEFGVGTTARLWLPLPSRAQGQAL